MSCLVCGLGQGRDSRGDVSRIGVCGLSGLQFSCLQTCSVRSASVVSVIASSGREKSSRTSTHWRNSGSLSPMEAWTPAQNSRTQMARARKSGLGRILPAPVVVMVSSSFNPRQSKLARKLRKGGGAKEEMHEEDRQHASRVMRAGVSGIRVTELPSTPWRQAGRQFLLELSSALSACRSRVELPQPRPSVDRCVRLTFLSEQEIGCPWHSRLPLQSLCR